MKKVYKNIKCLYKISFNQIAESANLVGVVINNKNEIIFQYDEEVKAEASHIAELIAINIIIKKLEEFELEGKISSDTSVLINGSGKGIIRRINRGNYKKPKKISILKEIISTYNPRKNWKIVWDKGTRKKLNKILHKQKTKNEKCENTIKANGNNTIVSNLIKNSETQIIFFDVEMNCINKQGANISGFEIISLGAVKCNTKLEISDKDTFHELIRPTVHPILSERCKEITLISQENIDAAYDFNTVVCIIENWVGDISNSIFVSWDEEDIKSIIRGAKINNNNSSILQIIDNKYANFQAEFSSSLSSKNPISLKSALNLCNIEFYGQQHNVIYDALNLAYLYVAYINKNYEYTQIRTIDLC